MTEDQIERAVERQVDRLDREYLTSGMSDADYKARLEAIHASAELLLTNRVDTPDLGR